MIILGRNQNEGFSVLGALIAISILGIIGSFIGKQVKYMEDNYDKQINSSGDLMDIRHFVDANFSCEKTLEQVNCDINSQFQEVDTFQKNGRILTDEDGTRFYKFEVKAECNGIHFDFFHRKFSEKVKYKWEHLYGHIPVVCAQIVYANGIKGGHFDVDTFEGNKNLKHVHAYDDKNSTNSIVYHGPFNQAKGKLSLLGSKKVSKNTIFTISLQNSNHSKGAKLKINENYYNWSKLPPNKTYSISNPAADQLVSELSVEYDTNSIAKGMIVCTDPKKVKRDPTHRDRALVVKLRQPSDNTLLWEGVSYWHDKDCKL